MTLILLGTLLGNEYSETESRADTQDGELFSSIMFPDDPLSDQAEKKASVCLQCDIRPDQVAEEDGGGAGRASVSPFEGSVGQQNYHREGGKQQKATRYPP